MYTYISSLHHIKYERLYLTHIHREEACVCSTPCTYVYIYIFICIITCLWLYIYVVLPHVCICIYICVYIYLGACIYIYLYAIMYMYLHIYIWQSYPFKCKLRTYTPIACMHINSVKFRPLNQTYAFWSHLLNLKTRGYHASRWTIVRGENKKLKIGNIPLLNYFFLWSGFINPVQQSLVNWCFSLKIWTTLLWENKTWNIKLPPQSRNFVLDFLSWNEFDS